MFVRIVVAVACAWGLTSNISAETQFQLFTNCEAVKLEIGLSEDATKIGLTRDEVITAVRSRLRSSNLYDATNQDFKLVADVHITGSVWFVSISLKKKVYDRASSKLDYAITWGYLYPANSPELVLSSVYRATDKFIDEWYRVNKPNGKCVERDNPFAEGK